MNKLIMLKSSAAKTLKDAFTEFIRYSKVKNLAEATIIYYETVLDTFIAFAGESTLVKDIDIEVIHSFILEQKINIKSTSVNTRLRGVRAFMYFCMERSYCNQFKIRLIKQEEIIKDTFTEQEMQLLLQKPDISKCSFTKYRNWAMVNFFLGTGIRRSTLVAIKICDLDLVNSVFTTKHNKNHKQQIIPISRILNKVLVEYLSHRGYKSDEDILFCDQYGKKFITRACSRAIRRYGEKLGIFNCGPHKFRHTFAKNWILAGGDIFRLQKILGHSNIEMVKKYVNIYGSELQKDFEKYNILDKLVRENKPIKMNSSKNKKQD